jgi:hypothetical protein
MRRRSTQILGILLALVVVLAAAGCGKKKSTTTSTTTTTTAAAETTTTSGTTTAASGLGALASAENCKQLSGLGQALSSALQGANGDVQKEVDVLKKFAAQTPPDIRPDFQTLADMSTKIVQALKSANITANSPPDATTLAKVMKVLAQFQDPKYTTALQHVDAWIAKNCHS